MDLFTSGMTIIEQIEILRNRIKDIFIKSGTIGKKTKIKLFYGDINDIGNNVLIITDPPKAKLFESREDKNLQNFISEFGLTKYFITYYYLLPNIKINRQEIKDFGYWIRQITDILDPKLIVCISEESQFCYFKRKFILRENHGKQIGEYNSIPIYASYPLCYYQKQSEFEDVTYKTFIKHNDWDKIKDKYNEVIKC